MAPFSDDWDSEDWEKELGGPDDSYFDSGNDFDDRPIIPKNEVFHVPDTPVVKEDPVASETIKSYRAAAILALGRAMRAGDIDFMRLLFDEAKLDPDTPLRSGKTVMMYAVFMQNPEMVQLCLDYGASPFATCGNVSVITEALNQGGKAGNLALRAALISLVEEYESNPPDLRESNDLEFWFECGETVETKDGSYPYEFLPGRPIKVGFPALFMMVKAGDRELFGRALKAGFDPFGQRLVDQDPYCAQDRTVHAGLSNYF